MPEELQKDPITRSDFLGFGVMGVIVGAVLTIPPAAFVLSPVIKTDLLGESDVASGPKKWFEVASIREVPEGEPTVFEVEFPVSQTYGNREIQEESGVSHEDFTVVNAIWLSWHSESGDPEESKPPEFVENLGEGDTLTSEQAREATGKLNVLSSSCAHLGCPVRWLVTEGEGEFLCPCHGGIYDINGGYIAGPPPRGMYAYAKKEVREDGKLYVQHKFDDPGDPYVI